MFLYNTSINSSTGFSPQFLTCGAEARIPADLVFSASDPNTLEQLSNIQDGYGSAAGLHSLFKSCMNLHNAFRSVGINLKSFHQKEKHCYDFGAVERVFHPRNIVIIRLKPRQPGPCKFKSKWSSPHQVFRVRGVLVTVREAPRVVSIIPTTTASLILFFRKFAPGTTEGAGVLPVSHANSGENTE